MTASLKVFIFLVFYCSQSYAGSTNNLPNRFSNKSLDTILHSSVTQLKRYDKITASNIISAYKMVNKGYVHHKIFSNAQKSIYRNNNFSVFKDWIGQIVFISKQKHYQKLRHYCDRLKKQVKSSNHGPLYMSLSEQSQLFCFRSYLDKLTYSFSKSNKIASSDLKIIKDHLGTLFHPYNQDNWYNFLDEVAESRTDLHKLISQYISDYYVKQKTPPKLETLQHIKITAELTRLIQLKGIEQSSVHSVFLEQLRGLIKEAFDAADSNRPRAEVITKTNHVVNFYTLNQNHLPINYSLKKLLSLGKSLSRRDLFDSANKVFRLMAKYPSDYLEKAYFEILWTNIVNENYNGAYKSINKLNLLSKINSISSSKLKYWTAYTLMQKGNKKYLSIMQSIVDRDPLDFYAVMSAKSLNESSSLSTDQVYKNLLIENKVPFVVSKKTFGQEVYQSLIRLKAWGELEFRDLVRAEHENLTDYHVKDVIIPESQKNKNIARSILTYMSAKALYERKNFLESFRVMYKGLADKSLELNANILNILFPRPYWNKIKYHAKSFDPTIALSLIRQESGFNRKARSLAGARGLMQIMPATGRMFKRRLRAKQLEAVNLNLWIGTKYFQGLLKKYNHNLVYALAAYNAGEGRVDRWQEEYLTSSSILHNIESIPFKETRKYVKLIFRNIFFYKLLESHDKQQDSEHPNRLFNIALGFKQ